MPEYATKDDALASNLISEARGWRLTDTWPQGERWVRPFGSGEFVLQLGNDGQWHVTSNQGGNNA